MKLRLTSKMKLGAVPAATVPASVKNYFRYASVNKLSKHLCPSCGTPIRRHGIRRVVLCPVCDAKMTLA